MTGGYDDEKTARSWIVLVRADEHSPLHNLASIVTTTHHLAARLARCSVGPPPAAERE